MGTPTGSKRHKHTFHGLWYHFGPYGRQDVHVHPCWDDDCDRVMIGDGRVCDRTKRTHHRETLRAG